MHTQSFSVLAWGDTHWRAVSHWRTVLAWRVVHDVVSHHWFVAVSHWGTVSDWRHGSTFVWGLISGLLHTSVRGSKFSLILLFKTLDTATSVQLLSENLILMNEVSELF